MSLALLLPVLAGVAGWLLTLAERDRPCSWLALVVEALAVESVVATLVAVGLVSFGVFQPWRALGLTAALAVAAGLGARRRPGRPTPARRVATRHEVLALVVLALAAPVVLPRMQPLRMDHDAGVYTNRALHHLRTGGLPGTVPVRQRLTGDLVATFDRDNMTAAAAEPGACPASYLPATSVYGPDCSRYRFQFFPGWPMLLALWAGIFGVAQMFDAVAFVYVLGVMLFALLVERLAEAGAARSLALLLYASAPLLVFLSKYTTSEAFLAFLFLFVLQFVEVESRPRALLAAAGVLLFAVSHASAFLYAPLLLAPLLGAGRSGDRNRALFLALSFAALLASLPLGRFFSPLYLRAIYASCFGLLPLAHPAETGLAIVALLYGAGLVLSSLLLLAAARERLASWAAAAERRLPLLVVPGLALMAVWTIWRGYQLGWTERFVERSAGAWGLRAEYAGRGLAALAHLDVVSMVMATSLVGLPVVLALAVTRRGELCRNAAQAFLLAAVLWSLALYTFFRVDTPFNYYASRYFAPVLLPSTFLLLGVLLGRFRPPRALLGALAVVGLGFNLYFDRVFLAAPSEQGRLRFVLDVAERVPPSRVLFVRADEPTHRLLAPLLQSLRGISVVRVAHLGGGPELPLVERYLQDLALDEAAVLSVVAPRARRATMLELEDTKLAERGVLYPTDYATRRRQYYFYTVSSPSGSAAHDRDQVQ